VLRQGFISSCLQIVKSSEDQKCYISYSSRILLFGLPLPTLTNSPLQLRRKPLLSTSHYLDVSTMTIQKESITWRTIYADFERPYVATHSEWNHDEWLHIHRLAGHRLLGFLLTYLGKQKENSSSSPIATITTTFPSIPGLPRSNERRETQTFHGDNFVVTELGIPHILASAQHG